MLSGWSRCSPRSPPRSGPARRRRSCSPATAATGHLLVVCTAERGLCGGFNASIARLAREQAAALIGQGKTVKMICVGKNAAKAAPLSRPLSVGREHAGQSVSTYPGTSWCLGSPCRTRLHDELFLFAEHRIGRDSRVRIEPCVVIRRRTSFRSSMDFVAGPR